MSGRIGTITSLSFCNEEEVIVEVIAEIVLEKGLAGL